MDVGQTRQFAAAVSDQFGDFYSTPVTWSVSGLAGATISTPAAC